MQWRQYSALSHASFDGYIGEIPAGAYFVLDRFPHEERPKIEKMYLAFLTRHIGRAALAMLCIVTELSCIFASGATRSTSASRKCGKRYLAYSRSRRFTTNGITR